MSSRTPLTWSLVPWGTEAIRASLPPNTSIRVVARQDDVAFVCSSPVASFNLERFQGDTGFVRRSVLQRRLACWRGAPVCDGAAVALFPTKTVKANCLKARAESSLLLEEKTKGSQGRQSICFNRSVVFFAPKHGLLDGIVKTA